MPGYVIYVDAWLLRLAANFVFVYLLLWATAEVTRTPTSRGRLSLGALFGTCHYLLFLMASLRFIPYYGLIRFFPVLFFTSLLMIMATFYRGPQSKHRIPTILGYFYGIGMISGGAGIAGAYLLGTPSAPHHTMGMLIAMAAILAIAELGWGIVQRRIFHHVYQIPIEIAINEQKFRINALVDTGNRLRDPLSQQPVLIVEYQALTTLFGPLGGRLLSAIEKGNVGDFDPTLWPDLASRFRLIPFRSLGKDNGLLIGLRPDSIRVLNPDLPHSTSGAIIAIHPQTLDPNGEYQALIPPEVVHKALHDSSSLETMNRGGQSHAASTHPQV